MWFRFSPAARLDFRVFILVPFISGEALPNTNCANGWLGFGSVCTWNYFMVLSHMQCLVCLPCVLHLGVVLFSKWECSNHTLRATTNRFTCRKWNKQAVCFGLGCRFFFFLVVVSIIVSCSPCSGAWVIFVIPTNIFPSLYFGLMNERVLQGHFQPYILPRQCLIISFFSSFNYTPCETNPNQTVNESNKSKLLWFLLEKQTDNETITFNADLAIVCLKKKSLYFGVI